MRKLTLLNLIIMALLMASSPLLAEALLHQSAFNVVSKSAQYMDIQCVLPTYQIESEQHLGTTFQKITMASTAYRSEEGMPELPTLSTMIAIPLHGSVHVEVLNTRSKTLQNINPYPVQSEKPEASGFSLDTEYYAGRTSRSQEIMRYSEPQIMRDLRVINLHIDPFVWDAASHQMVVNEEISLRLHFSSEAGINELQTASPISSAFDKIYQAQILNYEDYRSAVVANTPPRIVILHGDYNNSVFTNMINDFALWKRQKGADVRVLSTAVTGNTNTSIKSYLQNLYDNPLTRFDYIVIIGDVTGAFAIPGWLTPDGFGDYPYQMLAGTDQLGDAFIGRISAENTSQLYVILSKIYSYEKTVDVNNAQFLNRMLLVADTQPTGSSVVNLSNYIKDISLLANPDYTHTMLAQNSPNPSDMNFAINQGVSFFNFRGIGGLCGWSPSDTYLYNINKLFHAIVITCNTGDYDRTATTELILRVGTAAAPKGGVTAVGMWGSGTATMPNNALSGAIYQGIYIEGLRTMGEALLHSKLNFSRLYAVSNPVMFSTFSQWLNLMGDPTMEVYTGIPDTFESNAPATVPSGSNDLDLAVVNQHGYPVADAAVTVTHRQANVSTIVSRAYTDDQGLVHLQFSEDITTANLIVTISKHDFKPLQQTISVESGSLLAGIPIIDDNLEGESHGNGNGIANSGESLEVLFQLRNTSDEPITGITGSVSSPSPYVTISNSSVDFGSIAAGTSAFCSSPVVIEIDPQTPHNTLLRFILQLTDGDEITYTVAEFISVTDAELRYRSHQIIGGNNGVLDPGEAVNLSVSLQNIGAVAVEELVGELFTVNDLVIISDSMGSFGTINAEAQASTITDNFSIQARASVIPGMIIPLRLKLSNAAGYLQWLEFSLTIGTVGIHDPLGPDQYGYLIYDDTDTAYEDCPVYSWIEISPEEGGSGTILNIDDPDIATEGDGVNSHPLAVVNLPFSFQFYGEDHRRITVCSNGFIVFGITENHEFRNYRLPGPMGPAPMVAAFWDDLATGPESQVLTWFDSENHTFIIEWYQMQNGYLNQYPETFQIILYDPAHYPSSFGDGPIKIQYKAFNNVNSGATNQNHGNFATIGIKSPDHLDGLEYTFMNTYPTAASPLGHERAIYITNVPVYYDNPWLVLGDIAINGHNSPAQPGETVALGVNLNNLGNYPATEISTTLTTTDQFVTMINDSSEYHAIAGQNHGVNLDAFSFQISPNCPNDHSIKFSLNVNALNRSWTHNFRVEVKQPGLVYDTFYINDANGNNSGAADPDENFFLIINVANRSEADALNLTAELTSVNASFSLANPVIDLSVLQAGETAQFIFEAYLNASAVLNTTIPLVFSLAAANAPAITENITLGCGSMGYHNDFESDPGNLLTQGGWAWGSSTQIDAHSGSKLWATVLNGHYEHGANYMLTSAPISIGSGASLSFWHQMHCQDSFDGGNVSISINGGSSWMVVHPSSGGSYASSIYSMNEPGFTGSIAQWTKVSFNLASFANNEIRIRWHFTSDGLVNSHGWFIDDVQVSGFATKAGFISGNVTLSDAGNPSLAKVSIPLPNAVVVSHPDALGSYAAYLPQGAYELTASMPYHVTEISPGFVINDQSPVFVHDFTLIDLPAVSDFSLYHVADEAPVTLNWTAPQEPYYPVLSYRVYKQTGPGLAEAIAELNATSFTEDISLIGTYIYHVSPVYEAGEGAPSDTLRLQILPPPSSGQDEIAIQVNRLHPNSPNPFNPSTTISLDLVKAGTAQLKIYNLKGQLVKNLFAGNITAGHHRFVWDGLDNSKRTVASGVYLYRLETEGFVKTRRMLLMK